jgi:hypothetical protein
MRTSIFIVLGNVLTKKFLNYSKYNIYIFIVSIDVSTK